MSGGLAVFSIASDMVYIGHKKIKQRLVLQILLEVNVVPVDNKHVVEILF